MSTRVSKKLVGPLQNIDGAIMLINAFDPQIETIRVFLEAIVEIPHFVILNKTDLVSTTQAMEVAEKLGKEEIISASITQGKGLMSIRKGILKLPTGKVAVLGVFNSGKTSLINALTGEDNLVGDIPGTTLEISEHPYIGRILLDTVGQIIDVSKPLMISIDLTSCETTKDKLIKCLSDDAEAISKSIESALPGLEKAVGVIIRQVEKGKKVVITGAGASALVAMEMGGQSQETGLPALVFTNNFSDCQPISFAKGTGETELSLAEYFVRAIQEGDIAIAVSASGGTGFTYKFLELSKEKGAICIAITENADTPLGKAADIIIKSEAKPEGPSSSRIQAAHLAIGHALILTIADMRGIDAQKSIEFMIPKVCPTKKMGIK